MRYIKGKDVIGSAIIRLVLAAVFIISFSGLASADDPEFIQKDFQPAFHNVIPLNISNTGAATYSIPIVVPPGRGGIAMPDLALVYNSQQKNGWVGFGWDLEVGSIQRSTKWGVDYSGTDFVVDGAVELVPRTGWGSGYYGAKIEGGFTKYKFNGATSGWVATARDGTTYYYGQTSSSRQQSGGDVFRWCLDEVVDTNGNTMTITYTEDQGAIYPNRINYTGTKNYVIFTTENRPDAFSQYDTLSEVVMAKRLASIAVYGNSQLARKYELQYEEGTSSKRSRLTSVQVYGSNGSSTLPPMTFAWQEGGDGSFGNRQRLDLVQVTGTKHFGDINGDGHDDLVWIVSQDVYAYLSNGDGSFTNSIYTSLAAGGGTVYLFDVDGDGMADLLRLAGSNLYTHHSNGNGTFAASFNQTNVTYGDAYIGDINGDGLADFVTKPSGFPNRVYTHLSNGDGTFGSSINTSLTGTAEGAIRLGDVNGDGFADIVLYILINNSAILYTYFSQGDGTFSNYIDSGSFGYIDELYIADVNGDGFGDLIGRAGALGVTAYLSQGDGTYSACTERDFEGNKTSLADFNGDGCADLISYNNYRVYTYLCNGDGTFRDYIDTELYYTGGGCETLYVADVNGNGNDDIIQEYDNFTLYTYLADGDPSDLLTSIHNEFGNATIDISYTPSSAYQNTLLPFIVNTASTITVDDANGVVSTTDYTYEGGYYDYATREFRGFSDTMRTNPDGTTVTSLFQQDEFLKGRAYQIDFKNPSASLLTRQTLTWDTYPTSPTTWAFVKLAQNRTNFYNSPTVYVQEDNTYNNTHGSLLTTTTSGTDAENVTTTLTYVNKSSWLWRISKETITGGTTGDVRKTWYGYDGSGNMTSKELWLYGAPNPTIVMSYDSYGNLRYLTDAMGETTETRYDNATQTYPKKILYPQTGDGLNHVVEYPEYDYRFGKPTRKIDERDYETTYEYDLFGRLKQVDYPDGGQQTITYYDTTSPRYTLTKVKEASGQTIDTYEYRDGLDRTIQMITFGENTKSVVTRTYFDNMGRVDITYGPFFRSGIGLKNPPSDSPYVDTAYDYRGRPTQVTSPDGTYGTVSTTYSYSGFATTITDPDSKDKKETRDYLGRIIKVTEYIEAGARNTFYTYNAAGDLLTVDPPTSNDIITNTYDTLGRKIAMDDPDLGYWEYVYDANGNLISETNERTLVSVVTEATEVHNTYDEMNRVESETKFIEGAPEQDYTTLYEYDLAGKVTKQTYPDGYEVDYAYHPGSGLLYTATGSDAEVYATCTQYKPTGKMGRIAHDNNTTTTYTYDSKSTRLTGIVTVDSGASDIQDRTYTYSRVGDIIGIIDAIKGITYTYTYDNLHRLETETNTGTYDPVSLTYNAIGNITEKTVGSNIYDYAYNAAHKHAVKTITLNGTPYQYSYDEVGNMTGGPDFSDPANIATRSIAYYATDMPATIEHTKGANTVLTDFVYDGLGNRVRKMVQGGATTYYIGDHFEVKDGEETKYIFAGNLRVAKITDSEIDYYHKDHLSSSTVMTDATGTATETTDYMPFGHERDHTGTAVTDYKFTDQELDTETGLYNYDARHYDAVIGRFISADNIVQDYYDPQMLNRYSYSRNNPLIYTDPSGHIVETIWDVANIAMDAAAISYDIQMGDWTGLAIDTGCVIVDALATAAPVVPAGAGAIRNVTRGATWLDKAKDAIRLSEKLKLPMKKAIRKEGREILIKESEKFAEALRKGIKVEVHHKVPLEWAHKMGKNFDPNSLENLVGFEKKVHTKITDEWNTFSKSFKEAGKEPTTKQIKNFADRIMKKYEKDAIK